MKDDEKGQETNRLLGLRVREVSGVDLAANKRKFLLMKSKEGGEVTMAEKDAVVESAEDIEKRKAEAAKQQMVCMVNDAVDASITSEADCDAAGGKWIEAPAPAAAAKAEEVPKPKSLLEKIRELIAGEHVDPTVKAEKVNKTGRVLRKDLEEQLKQALGLIQHVIDTGSGEGESPAAPALKIDASALEPLREEMAKLTKAVEPFADLKKSFDAAIEEIDKQFRAMEARLDTVEETKGIKKSIPGQEPQPADKKESIWAGVV